MPDQPRRVSEFLAGLRELVELNKQLAPEVEAAEEALRKYMAEERKTLFPAHLARCGATEEIVDAYRQGVQPRPVFQAVKKWLETDKSLCVLLGTSGIGKSVAAAYSLRLATRWIQMAPNHPRAQKIDVEELYAPNGLFLPAFKLRHAQRYPSDEREASVITQAHTVRVLVLDDLGGDDFKGVGAERFEALIWERYEEHRRTVITSNMTAAEFLKRFDPKIASRLEKGAVLFESGGTDLRRTRGAA